MNTRARRVDQGETLVELLLAVMIMGICTASIMGTVMLTVSASAQNASTVLTASISRTWAERVSSASYQSCSTPSTTLTAPEPAGWAGSGPTWTRRIDGVQYTATVLAVEHWSTDAARYVSPCAPDSGLQRHQLRVSAAGLGLQGASEDTWIVTRNPCTATSQAGCS